MIDTQKAKKHAAELTHEYKAHLYDGKSNDMANACALVHCNGILRELLDHREQASKFNNERIRFWQMVIKELGNHDRQSDLKK